MIKGVEGGRKLVKDLVHAFKPIGYIVLDTNIFLQRRKRRMKRKRRRKRQIRRERRKRRRRRNKTKKIKEEIEKG